MDYPKLPRKPHLFWKPPGTRVTHQILRALETVKQRSDIYLRNGINCVSVQCGEKKNYIYKPTGGFNAPLSSLLRTFPTIIAAGK